MNQPRPVTQVTTVAARSDPVVTQVTANATIDDLTDQDYAERLGELRANRSLDAFWGAVESACSKSVEQWKPVHGYEGWYEVSSWGNVRRIRGGRGSKKDCILKSQLRNKYPVVTLSRFGRRSIHYVHRLVAKAFLPNPDSKPEVNHKDGNRTNNRVTNLEWVTCAENSRHAYTVLRSLSPPPRIYGQKHYKSRLTPDQTATICERYAAGGVTQTQLANEYKVSQAMIWAIARNKHWSTR